MGKRVQEGVRVTEQVCQVCVSIILTKKIHYSWIPTFFFEMPFFFKVDAQGMEARVLEGARLTNQRDLPVLYGA